MVLGRREPLGVLYQVDAHGQVRDIEHGVIVSNATAFSPDGRWMYFADSHARQIWRYPYDNSTGNVGPREVFIDTAPLKSGADGATVDAEGGLWVALMSPAALERLERELGVYRRLYRGALEMMKAARRREAAKRPLPPAP